MHEQTLTKGDRMASWIIIDKATGKAVLETFNRKVASAINTERYEVVPILQYLYQLNRTIKQAQA